jgi:hypothetical protein
VTARRGFVWALAASLLVHVLTLLLSPARFAAEPPPAAGDGPPIAARLQPPPAPDSPPAPVLAPVAAPRPARPAPPVADSPAPPAVPPATTAAEPASARSPESAGDSEAAREAAAAAAAAAAQLAAEAARQAAQAAAAAADAAQAAAARAAADPPPGSVRFPRSGRLEYAVTVGASATPIGRATYTWEASDSSYRLSLVAQTTGLAGLLRRVRVEQISRGRITPDGVRPDAFQMDRGPAARNEFARFDWVAKQLTFGYPDATETGVLAAGAQDMLSLILQLAFVPIIEGKRELQLTTGRRLYQQSYERVGEDVIETAGGAWRAWHLRRVRLKAEEDGYDLWLAIDRPFLPVRIRWTERGGRTLDATLDTLLLSPQ